MNHRCPFNCIVPPHMLSKLLESKDPRISKAALSTMLASTAFRSQRGILGLLSVGTPAGTKRRTIYDARNQEREWGLLVRGEGDPAVSDRSVNQAYDGLGVTYDFYKEVYDRNSLDGNGMRLDAVVHHGEEFNNAFWQGQLMVFGDGDGRLFTDFTKSLDVIAHELTHGVTEFTAGLIYHNQPGALNESMSDVFGSLVRQKHSGHDAAAADWLIGADIFTPEFAGDALRSLKSPGSAYDNEVFGRDPQPAHMSDYRHLPDTRQGDWGGVHVNSGIPNHAFYLIALSLGGNAWDAPGHIWYETLTRNLGPTSDFQGFADATHAVAGRLYGAGSAEQQAVRDGWREVGIRVAGGSFGGAGSTPVGKARVSRSDEGDSLVELRAKVNALAQRLDEVVRRMK